MKTVYPTLKMTLTDFVISGSTSAQPPGRQKLKELLHLKRANRNLRSRFKHARTRQREGSNMLLEGPRSHVLMQQRPSSKTQLSTPATQPVKRQLEESSTQKKESVEILTFD